MREKNEKVVTFKDITPFAMKTLLDFLYTEEIVLTEDNVSDILYAASIMQIEGKFLYSGLSRDKGVFKVSYNFL